MSYTITITETRDVVKRCGKEWTTIGTKEVERDDRFVHSGDNEPKTRIDSVYGYTPEIEKTVPETRELFKQTVETVSLNAVIRAINEI